MKKTTIVYKPKRTIKDGLVCGDYIVKSSPKTRRRILGVCDDAIFLADLNPMFGALSAVYTLEELINSGYELEDKQESNDIPEYTWEELKIKLGHEFKIKE